MFPGNHVKLVMVDLKVNVVAWKGTRGGALDRLTLSHTPETGAFLASFFLNCILQEQRREVEPGLAHWPQVSHGLMRSRVDSPSLQQRGRYKAETSCMLRQWLLQVSAHQCSVVCCDTDTPDWRQQHSTLANTGRQCARRGNTSATAACAAAGSNGGRRSSAQQKQVTRQTTLTAQGGAVCAAVCAAPATVTVVCCACC